MDKFIIRGGNPLVGTVRVSGAKNSALPCMAAAILTDEEITLENIPHVRDIATEGVCWLPWERSSKGGRDNHDGERRSCRISRWSMPSESSQTSCGGRFAGP